MKRIAVLFSGQGSQYVGMGKRLYERDAASRAMFDAASSVLDIDLKHLCFDGNPEELNQTENTQPALLLCAVLDYRHFHARTGIAPKFFAGHSLGELSALVAAQALSLEDGLRLARARGLAMSRSGTSEGLKTGMHAVTKIERRLVEEICQSIPGFKQQFVIANFNAPNQCVLSGSIAVMEKAGEQLKKAGGNIIPLKVSGPFHSPYMAQAAQEFADVLHSVKMQAPKIPVIANVNAQAHGEPAQIVQSLLQQITSPVMWNDSMQLLRSEGIDVYLEAGPRAVLKKLVLSNVAGAQAFALDEEDDQPGIEKAFAFDLRQMRERPSLIGKCMAVAVATKNSNWDDSAYQQGVVEPYRTLQTMQEKIEREGVEASLADMQQALDLLNRIFDTKGTGVEERAWRWNQILQTSGMQQHLQDHLPGYIVAHLASQTRQGNADNLNTVGSGAN